MPPYGLVVLSAALHAWWNYLVKRRGGTTLFVGLTKIAEVVVFAPVFVVATSRLLADTALAWPGVGALVVVGALLTLANYVFLAFAYRHGDLSFVYPVSRGTGLMLLPALGFAAFGERLSVLGAGAIVLILAGLATMTRTETRAVRGPARPGRVGRSVGYAFLAGTAAAGYTVWDKHAISVLPAFVYFYSYSTLVAAAYGGWVLRRVPRTAIRAEWRAHAWPIVQVGVCNTIAYLLVLLALRTGTSSYVIAVRQLSIVFGALLGGALLGERFPAAKRVGLGMVAGGCALVALGT